MPSIELNYNYDDEVDYEEHIKYLIDVLYNTTLDKCEFIDGNIGNLKQDNLIFV